MSGLRLALCALFLMACGGAPTAPEPAGPAPGNAEVVLSLQEITCQSCGAKSITALKGKPGVEATRFDAKTAELTVEFDPKQTTPAALAGVVGELGYGVHIGPGEGRYTKVVAFAPELDFKWIAQKGEAPELEANLVPGKVTVFDFSADWCGPCKEVDRAMLAVLELKDDVALRKLNIIDWESPAAKRYLTEVKELPYVVVYGVKGKRVAAISGLHLDQLNAAIEEGRKQ